MKKLIFWQMVTIIATLAVFFSLKTHGSLTALAAALTTCAVVNAFLIPTSANIAVVVTAVTITAIATAATAISVFLIPVATAGVVVAVYAIFKMKAAWLPCAAQFIIMSAIMFIALP
jgi:hypothetical protein